MLHTFRHWFKGIFRKRYERTYAQARLLFIVDVFLIIFSLGLLGTSLFFFFRTGTVTDPLRVTLDLGEHKLTSGQDLTLTITYHNRSLKNLHDISFQVYAPHGFIAQKDSSEHIFDTNLTTTVLDMHPEEGGQTHLTGKFWSEPGIPQKFFVTTRYTVGTKDYEQTTVYLATVRQSVLKGHFTLATTTTYPGKQIGWSYSLENDGTETVADATSMNAGDLELRGASSSFPVEHLSLKPGEHLNLNGFLVAPEKTGAYVTGLETNLRLQNGSEISQNIATSSLEVLYPELLSKVVLENKNEVAHAGKTVSLLAGWKNISSITVHNAALILEVIPNITAKTVTIPLGTLAPGEFGSSTVLLSLDKLLSTTSSFLNITPIISGETDAIKNVRLEIPGESVTLPIETIVRVNTQVRYYTTEGDQLGRGPLPPHANNTTRYWLAISARSSVRDLTNAELHLTLGSHAHFTGKQNLSGVGGLTFSPSSTTALWSGTLPASATTTWYAEVALEPTTADVGTLMTVVSQGTFNGTDELTKTDFNLALPETTNQLELNDQGSSAGARILP